MSERQIDAAIDAAVRELMDVDADATFRARVAATLHKRKAPLRFWRALAVASTAAALIAIGVSVVRETPTPQSSPAGGAASVDRRADTTARAVEPPAQARATPPGRARTIRQDAATHVIARGTLVAAVGDVAAADVAAADVPAADVPLTDATVRIEPLAAIPPITVAALSQAPLSGASEIVVAPLAPLPQLAVAPLDGRDQRD